MSRKQTKANVTQIEQAAREYAVDRYHKPRVAIVIPHYNCSNLIGDALLSVQQQTYGNIKCIVVDDFSTEAHFAEVKTKLATLADERFRLVRNAENLGQILSVYRGIEEIDAAFLAILDPDDRYTPDFISRMIAVHLNPVVFCPLVSCDQYLLSIGDGITTATQSASGLGRILSGEIATELRMFEQLGFHRFIPPSEQGWHWTTTSSMMFRTDALRLLKPSKKLAYKNNADAYFANGSHMLGGTMLLRLPLVYRGIHGDNEFICESIFSMFQIFHKPNAVHVSDVAKRDVIKAFLVNGGLKFFSSGDFQALVHAQFTGSEFEMLSTEKPEVAALFSAK